jgi:colanic acid biosynthesis glycosyl transferase WcaI
MRILIYSANFSPEIIGIGKYNGELAHFLSNAGHDIRVIAAPPYYPAWKVSGRYSSFRYLTESLKGGIKVFRCPIWVPAFPTGFKRILHLISFALSSFPVVLMQIFWRPQLVFVVEPTIFCAPSALLLSKLCRSQSWLHIQDFEVDAAFDMGIIKSALLRLIILRVESYLFQMFDRVSTISQKMLIRAAEKGVDKSRLYLFRNWIDLSRFSQANYSFDGLAHSGAINHYRSLLNISETAVVALYSGNMGAKQGLELLGPVMRLYQMHCSEHLFDLHLVLAGDGPIKKALVEHFLGVQNVHFLDLQPESMFLELLDMADIHLLPQCADVADLVMPSKLIGMFASGKVVLTSAYKNTELESIVKDVGIVVPPNSPRLFYDALMMLAKNGKRRMELGLKGKIFAKFNFDRDLILKNFNATILSDASVKFNSPK